MILPFLLLSRRIQSLLRKNFVRLALFVAGVVTYGTFSEFLLERDIAGSGVKNLFDGLWFVMQTITTVGYGDTPVISFWGRVNAIALMVVGIGVLGFFSASFATVLIDYSSKRRLGERRSRMKNHVLICNWNAIAQELVDEITKARLDALLLAPAERAPHDTLEFIRGSCLDLGDLKRAGAEDAESVIILSELITDGEFASAIDAKTILGVMNVRQLTKRAHVVVELLRSDSVQNAKHAGADEVVVRGELSAKVLSRAALDPGTIDIVQTILTAKSGEEIFEDQVPAWAVGKSYSELAKFYLEMNASPIALRSSKGLKINPPRDTQVGADSIVYIASQRIKNSK